jgi:ABC-type antimicrobial peptide transport system permease subunit
VTPATILLVVPVMISLGITIALFPAVVAARTQPSRVLRAE